MRLARKQLRSFRQGRIRASYELRRQRRIRNNLERAIFRRLTSLLPKFIRTEAYDFSLSGFFEPAQAVRNLELELLPVMARHYRRVFITMYEANEGKYEAISKSIDAPVFGRHRDIEGLIGNYNQTRQLYLSGIAVRLSNRVAKVIADGREESLSLTQIAKAIVTKVAPISRARAALIARTETHNAASLAHDQYHGALSDELGISMKKRWLSTSDLRTRSAHRTANRQTVDMNEPFIVGGYPMMFAGDPKGGAANVVNCRCVIIYVDSRDVDSLSN